MHENEKRTAFHLPSFSGLDNRNAPQREGVRVSLAGVGVGSGATAESSSNSSTPLSYDGKFFDYSQNYAPDAPDLNPYFTAFYTNRFSQTTTQTQDWTGSFEVGGDLTGNALLAQLLTMRQLEFGLEVSGDLYLVSGSLLLDVTETFPNAEHTVPEPGSLALALSTLAGFGAAGWRRRRR